MLGAYGKLSDTIGVVHTQQVHHRSHGTKNHHFASPQKTWYMKTMHFLSCTYRKAKDYCEIIRVRVYCLCCDHAHVKQLSSLHLELPYYLLVITSVWIAVYRMSRSYPIGTNWRLCTRSELCPWLFHIRQSWSLTQECDSTLHLVNAWALTLYSPGHTEGHRLWCEYPSGVDLDEISPHYRMRTTSSHNLGSWQPKYMILLFIIIIYKIQRFKMLYWCHWKVPLETDLVAANYTPTHTDAMPIYL